MNIVPNTTSNAVVDVDKEQSLRQTLLDTPSKEALGYDDFSIAEEYVAGQKVYHKNKLWKFVENKEAGAWDESKVELTSVNEYLDAGMTDINRDMGKYQQLPDVTLTLVESGKRIDKDGNFVADSAWNVGRLGQVSKGNIYELLMGGSDKMVLGTALFVSHTIERIGGQDKDVYKPIYSAVTADLPISTYAVLLAGEDYSDVLVSYRNDVSGANVLKVARWGIFASIATQLANLRGEVDLKAYSNSFQADMGVGYALQLIGDGEATAEEFTERVAGGTHQIDDALAEYVTVKGNSVVWNQLLGYFRVVSGSASVDDSTIVINGNAVIDETVSIKSVQGHKYLVIIDYNSTIDGLIEIKDYVTRGYLSTRTLPSSGRVLTYINECLADKTDTINIQCSNYVSGSATIHIVAFDLTQWYNGNVPEGLTAEQFIALNPDVLTMPYTEPHIVNMTAEGVKTTGRNLWDEEWEVGGIDGYGQVISNNQIHSKNFIPCRPNARYYVVSPLPVRAISYDANFNMVDYRTHANAGNRMFDNLTPSNAAYMKICTFSAEYGNTYKNDIAIFNYVQGMSTDYEPHITSERKWTETINKCFPDGMAKAGNVYDEFGATKAVQRIRVVDLGSLEWYSASNTFFVYNVSLMANNASIICSKYNSEKGGGEAGMRGDKVIRSRTDYPHLYVNDSSIESNPTGTPITSPAFKTAMQGVKLYYELAEPIVTTYDELNLTSRVWRNGMESIIVPEGKESSPISADVIYQINAFKTIKANKQGIEDLNAKPAISLTADEVAKLRALIANTQNLEE